MEKLFRVWDSRNDEWVDDEVFLGYNGDLIQLIPSKNPLSKYKVKVLLASRYVYQRSIGYRDKNNILLFEGDVLRLEIGDKEQPEEVIGVVAYDSGTASYYVWDYSNHRFYVFSEDKKSQIEKVGSVKEDPNIVR